MRRRNTARIAALLVTSVALSLAAPPTARADAPVNPWTRWTAEVIDRPTKAEIPLAVLASIPAMLTITPIWLGQLALWKISGDEE